MKRNYLGALALIILLVSSCSGPESPWTPPETPSPIPPLPPSPATTPVPPTSTTTPAGIETENLIIHYPDFIDEKVAKEQATILQEAYDFYYDLIGRECPFNGRKIEIIFDSSLGNISYAGNPIRMGTDSGIFDGRILPPEPAFFHEMVHDFTTGDRTSVAKYVDINGAITEAFADLFAYYFAHEELKYSKDDINRWDEFATGWRNKLNEYESKEIDPYSLNWGPHKDAQPYVNSIFFHVSEKYGWDVWNRFFRVARNSNVEGIPLHRCGKLKDLRKRENAIIFGNFVYVLSVASGEDLIPTFENWGFQFEKQTKEKASNMYKDYTDYLSGLASQYYEEGLHKRDAQEYAKAVEKLALSIRIYENLGLTQKAEEIEILLEEIKSKNIIIDGVMNEWSSVAVMISDPSGDVSSNAGSEKGVDLKAVYALMDENYLYVAIQIYGVFAPSLLRNYFIALDFDKDQRDEYHFGVRPSGDTWVFDHTRDKNNWNADSTFGVVAVGERDTIEIRIPRKEYKIPASLLIYCRVTGGGLALDSTKWFEVFQMEVPEAQSSLVG